MRTLRIMIAGVVLLVSLPLALVLASDKEPCEAHPDVVQAANLIFAVRRGIHEYKSTYGRLPEHLERLGPNRPGVAPSADSAAIVPSELLETKKYKYQLRYDKSEDGYKVWLTPQNQKKGCGSFLLSSDGTVWVRWSKGEASSQDTLLEGRLRVPGDWMQKRLVAQYPPAWPRELRKPGIQGEVRMRVVADKQGKVRAVGVESGPSELAPYDVDCLKRWSYEPILVDGLHIEAEFPVSIFFKLSSR